MFWNKKITNVRYINGNCPKCGSSNVDFNLWFKEYNCNKCGHSW
jgi:Zn ribbon nucleic-acid-binding protein